MLALDYVPIATDDPNIIAIDEMLKENG